MPVWLTFVLMVLATYRVSRLIVRDTFPPILWVRDRLAGGWRKVTPEEQMRITKQVAAGKPIGPDYLADNGTWTSRYLTRKSWSPYWLAELLSCIWCASGWVSGAVTASVDIAVGIPSPWLVGPAVWGAAAWLLSQE